MKVELVSGDEPFALGQALNRRKVSSGVTLSPRYSITTTGVGATSRIVVVKDYLHGLVACVVEGPRRP